MTYQDTLVQLLLMDEVDDIFCHRAVRVLLGVERLAMIPEILIMPLT